MLQISLMILRMVVMVVEAKFYNRFVWVPAIYKPKREKIGEQDKLDIGVVSIKVTLTPKLVQISIE